MQGPQLGQIPQALLRGVVLLVGVGEERDGGVQGRGPAHAREALGIKQRGLKKQQQESDGPKQQIAEQQGAQVIPGLLGRAAPIPHPTHQGAFQGIKPAIQPGLGVPVEHLPEMAPQQRDAGQPWGEQQGNLYPGVHRS